MLSDSVINNLKTDFETYGRLPSEDFNKTFLRATEKIVNGFIDKELVDDNLNDADLKIAFLMHSLFLYNNRDFLNKQSGTAVYRELSNLLARITNLSRYIPETNNG